MLGEINKVKRIKSINVQNNNRIDLKKEITQSNYNEKEELLNLL